MADESGGQEKTEEPTPKRLTEARNKGDVAKSMEVPSAAVLFSGIMSIYLLSDYMMGSLFTILRHYLSNLHTITLVPDNISFLIREAMLLTAKASLPVMAIVFIVALLANYAQVGVMFSTEKLVPDIKKLDPIKGLAKMFSMQMLMNTAKSIAKVAIIGWVAYSEIVDTMPEINPLMDQDPRQIFYFIARVSFWIVLKSIFIMIIVAILDYAFQRYDFRKKMRMTKQELKDEAKQTEGDPQVKGRIRSIQMEMARKRMMAEVPTADVVITNPVHLAVALRYDSMTMTAPTVVAKGAGLIAQRIKEIAGEHNIPIVEDRPLARALYKAADLDEMVPENLFQAVAEVLAYVYNHNRKSA